MDKLEIKTHDFELAKDRLKTFSNEKVSELNLASVQMTGGFLGLGEHKVTGYEFNQRLEKVQEHLININTTNNKTIKEFGQVYNALEALDKDYIQAILISIKATEITSEGIKVAQEKIEKVVQDQIRTVKKLQDFKEKLEGYTHLSDVDNIWKNFQSLDRDISTLRDLVNEISETMYANIEVNAELKSNIISIDDKISKLQVYNKKNIEEISRLDDGFKEVNKYIEGLGKISHLKDVDEMWDDNNKNSEDISKLQVYNKKNIEEISRLDDGFKEVNKYIEGLEKISHLKDVDEMWDDNNKFFNELVNLDNENKKLHSLILIKEEKMISKINDIMDKNELNIRESNKKLKYAYILSGVSLGITILGYLFLLIR